MEWLIGQLWAALLHLYFTYLCPGLNIGALLPLNLGSTGRYTVLSRQDRLNVSLSVGSVQPSNGTPEPLHETDYCSLLD